MLGSDLVSHLWFGFGKFPLKISHIFQFFSLSGQKVPESKLGMASCFQRSKVCSGLVRLGQGPSLRVWVIILWPQMAGIGFFHLWPQGKPWQVFTFWCIVIIIVYAQIPFYLSTIFFIYCKLKVFSNRLPWVCLSFHVIVSHSKQAVLFSFLHFLFPSFQFYPLQRGPLFFVICLSRYFLDPFFISLVYLKPLFPIISINSSVSILFLIGKVINWIFALRLHLYDARNFCLPFDSSSDGVTQICPKCDGSRCAGVRQIWNKFVKILSADSSRTFEHRKGLYKHKLKAHYRASFTQNPIVFLYKRGSARASATMLTELRPTQSSWICEKFAFLS